MKRKQSNLLSTILPAFAVIAILGIAGASWVKADFVLAQRNGDVNASGTIDISDGVYLLRHLFSGGPEPIPLACEPDVLVYFGQKVHNGDVNGRGGINITDAVYLFDWLFRGGPAPVPACPGE